MIEDKLDEVRDLDEYYDRVVLGGNVTVRTRIENDTEPDKAADRKATPVYSGVLKYVPNAHKEDSKWSLPG